MLKVFAEADPRPLMEERVVWHREKLAELQNQLNDVGGARGRTGTEHALAAGLIYHRKMLEFLDRAHERNS